MDMHARSWTSRSQLSSSGKQKRKVQNMVKAPDDVLEMSEREALSSQHVKVPGS